MRSTFLDPRDAADRLFLKSIDAAAEANARLKARSGTDREAPVWRDYRTRRPDKAFNPVVVYPRKHPDGTMPPCHVERTFDIPARDAKPKRAVLKVRYPSLERTPIAPETHAMFRDAQAETNAIRAMERSVRAANGVTGAAPKVHVPMGGEPRSNERNPLDVARGRKMRQALEWANEELDAQGMEHGPARVVATRKLVAEYLPQL